MIEKTGKSFLWNLVNKLGTYGLEFILSIVLARGLGAYYFGVYNELLNFIFLFSFFSTLGVDTALNVFLPKLRESKSTISWLIRKSLQVVFMATLLGLIVLIAFKKNIAELINSPELVDLFVIAAGYILLFNFFLIAQSILFSNYQTKALAAFNASFRLAKILISLVLFKIGLGLYELVLSFTAILLVLNLVLLLFLRHSISQKPEKGDIKEFMSFGFNSWLVKIVNYVLGRYFDIMMLGFYNLPKQETGFYTTAVTLTMSMAYLFSAPFSGITMTAFSEMEAKNNFSGMAKGWQVFAKTVSIGALPIFLFSIYYADSLIGLLYSDTYVPAGRLFQIFAAFYLLSLLLGSGTNSTILFAIKKDRLLIKLRVIFGLVNVVLDIVLIPLLQTAGVILATGFSILTLIFSEYVAVKKYVPIKIPVAFMTKIFVASVIALLVSLLVPLSGMWWVSKTIVYAVIILLFIWKLKPFDMADYDLVYRMVPRFAPFIKAFCQEK